jgi:hypothetical protein
MAVAVVVAVAVAVGASAERSRNDIELSSLNFRYIRFLQSHTDPERAEHHLAAGVDVLRRYHGGRVAAVDRRGLRRLALAPMGQ